MARKLREAPGEINATLARAPSAHEVRVTLDTIRGGLLADGGNVELLDVQEDGTVVVELQGACRRCPAQSMTLRHVIEARLRETLEGVTEVLAL